MIFPISASQVTTITGMSHWHLGLKFSFLRNFKIEWLYLIIFILEINELFRLFQILVWIWTSCKILL
jgi:hypothetical protein